MGNRSTNCGAFKLKQLYVAHRTEANPQPDPPKSNIQTIQTGCLNLGSLSAEKGGKRFQKDKKVLRRSHPVAVRETNQPHDQIPEKQKKLYFGSLSVKTLVLSVTTTSLVDFSDNAETLRCGSWSLHYRLVSRSPRRLS